jgi:hypothetical protein
MKQEIKIEKNIPIPTDNISQQIEGVLPKLKVGDSFVAKFENYAANNAISRYKQKTGSKSEFITRKEGKLRRLWRIK